MLSQNLRLDTSVDGVDNDIFLRSDRFLWLLEKYKPDIAGLQEFTPTWDAMIYEWLEEHNYGIVLKYRGSDQEGTPIIYNKDKLTLESEAFFWLSDTPEVASPSWNDGDGKRNRIVTECVFKDKKSGIRFVHLNTHFGLTTYCQNNSGTLLNNYVKENYADMPVFLTGDFNTAEGSRAYENLTADDLLINSYYLAQEFGNVTGTFNNFEEGDFGPVVDFVFVTEQVTPVYYSVLNDKPDGYFVSDHYGVLTKHVITK